MYPNQATRDLVEPGKCLCTYHKSGPDHWMFTCWGPSYDGCGVHSCTDAELQANIRALSDRYTVIGR